MTEVDEIKQKLDIVDVVGQYVSLKKSGKNYKGLCPFHSEKTPSFMVNQELQIYKCFGCNEGGDIFSFIEKIEGYDFRQALEILAEKAGVKLTTKPEDANSDNGRKKVLYEINEISKRFYQVLLLKHELGKNALEYLTVKRKLSMETIRKFELGYAPNAWGTLNSFLLHKGFTEKDLLKSGIVSPDKFERHNNDKFRNRVIFPLTGIDGNVLGFGGRSIDGREPKYLNTQDTTIYHKEHFLYGLDKTRMEIKNQGAVVVEGYMDAISAYQCGIKNVVAICGTALTIPHLKIISRYSKDLTLCFDSDRAGVSATLRAIEMSSDLGLNIKVVILPNDVKDIDELASKKPDSVIDYVKNAVPSYDFVIKTSLETNDSTSPFGKRKIAEEVCGYLIREKSPVVTEYYIKVLAEKLQVDQTSIAKMLEGKTPAEFSTEENTDAAINNAKSPQEYLLALIFSQKTLDKTAKMVQNLTPEEVDLSSVSELYELLISFTKGDPKSEVKAFINSLTGENLVKARDISLWDVSIPKDEDKFIEEVELTVKRIKKEAARKKMTQLSFLIKEAERLKDTDKIVKLTEEFNNLSKLNL